MVGRHEMSFLGHSARADRGGPSPSSPRPGHRAIPSHRGVVPAGRGPDAATRAAAEALAQQRTAALRALRETHHPTAGRDARTAWEEQARKLEE